MDRILAYATLLHDFGKVHPGFQAMLRGGPSFQQRHEVLSLAFLSWLRVPEEEQAWLAAGIATHHRTWPSIDTRHRMSGTGTDLTLLCEALKAVDCEWLHRLLARAPELFAELGWPRFEPYHLLPFQRLTIETAIRGQLALVATLARRIAPVAFLPPPPDWGLNVAGIHVRGWMLSADHLASCQPHPIRAALRTTSEVRAAYPGFVWAAHQQAAANCTDSALLVAPTGAGKTEAALLWAARQGEEGRQGRVCVLLPYQTSLNAMQSRLLARFHNDAMREPERWNEHVSLLHGRASRRLYEAFLQQGEAPARASAEALEQVNLARLFAAPMAVSTAFSVIRLLLATSGPERLMTAFHRARIVVDEIHAYDPKVTALTVTALRFLQEHLDSRMLLMSATVPTHLETALCRLLNIRRIQYDAPEENNPRHAVELIPGHCLSGEGIEQIRRAAEHGSVLVAVNQVRRAMALCERLRPLARDVRLLHSRFTFRDRGEIEARLSPSPGTILVGTQAVEVSLDLDFDTCFSEMAPLEALIQRFGRCNRRGKQAKPAQVRVFRDFPPGRQPHLPYPVELVGAVADTLGRFCGCAARPLRNADVAGLLDGCYPEPLRRQLQDQLTAQSSTFKRLFLDTWKPFGMAAADSRADLEAQWAELFDGSEAVPEGLVPAALREGTRLGAARYLVPISARQRRQFRGEINLHPELGYEVIRRPYDSMTGLDLHSQIEGGGG